MSDKKLEKRAGEIEKEEIPEPIIEIAKILCPKLEKKYDEIRGEENYIVLMKKVGNKEVVGGLTFNMKEETTTYSITIHKRNLTYEGDSKHGIISGGLTQFLKSMDDTIKMVKNKKKLKKLP